MITIRFVKPDGGVQVVKSDVDMTLMEAARNAGIPGILAECGGGAICSTCHVHVAPEWLDKLSPKEPSEDILLELAPGRDAFSRLSCQIVLDASHAGLTVRVPEKQSDY